MENLVLCMEKIVKQATRNIADEDPDAEKYKETFAAVRKQLLDSGYTEAVPELFGELCDYAARYLLGCEPKGLVLIGSCGIGKTEGVRRLSAILRIAFVTTEMLISAFGSRDYQDMISGTDFFGEKGRDLIIDEVGTEAIPLVYYGTRYNVLEDVFYARYNAFKTFGSRTIITTNKNLEELKRIYGGRVSDRFWESCRIREYGAPSMRKMKK